ncbi:hypothetical protein TIFTF001_021073 [Ficus carica]|uniref:Uncharacterized protein n=1 Tax=Ficus carica TaxID=3494 RepID=A0AA88AJR2_FICCA|nr:hypothetical protein TIFTF001_021073 [Ficus carica]
MDPWILRPSYFKPSTRPQGDIEHLKVCDLLTNTSWNKELIEQHFWQVDRWGVVRKILPISVGGDSFGVLRFLVRLKSSFGGPSMKQYLPMFTCLTEPLKRCGNCLLFGPFSACSQEFPLLVYVPIPKTPSTRYSWQKPCSGHVNINVDAAIKEGLNFIGIGVVVRDDNAREGAFFAQMGGLDDLTIESDAVNVV